jgi:hypothetical protein
MGRCGEIVKALNRDKWKARLICSCCGNAIQVTEALIARVAIQRGQVSPTFLET